MHGLLSLTSILLAPKLDDPCVSAKLGMCTHRCQCAKRPEEIIELGIGVAGREMLDKPGVCGGRWKWRRRICEREWRENKGNRRVSVGDGACLEDRKCLFRWRVTSEYY